VELTSKFYEEVSARGRCAVVATSGFGWYLKIRPPS
jgi:hypothetical protein